MAGLKETQTFELVVEGKLAVLFVCDLLKFNCFIVEHSPKDQTLVNLRNALGKGFVFDS